MLSIKDEYTLRLGNFLIIALCDSSANCRLVLIAASETLLPEYY